MGKNQLNWQKDEVLLFGKKIAFSWLDSQISYPTSGWRSLQLNDIMWSRWAFYPKKYDIYSELFNTKMIMIVRNLLNVYNSIKSINYNFVDNI